MRKSSLEAKAEKTSEAMRGKGNAGYQPARVAAVPEGLVYIPDFITPAEETALIAEVENLTFREVRMHGVVARRTAIHFGWDYDYSGWRIEPGDPPPSWLAALRDRCAAIAEIEPERLEQFLIARYPPGASIGWHHDAHGAVFSSTATAMTVWQSLCSRDRSPE